VVLEYAAAAHGEKPGRKSNYREGAAAGPSSALSARGQASRRGRDIGEEARQGKLKSR